MRDTSRIILNEYNFRIQIKSIGNSPTLYETYSKTIKKTLLSAKKDLYSNKYFNIEYLVSIIKTQNKEKKKKTKKIIEYKEKKIMI